MRRWLRRATSVRIGLAGVLGVLLVVVARNVFDDAQWSLLAVPIAVTAAAWLTVRAPLRWRILGAAAATVVALAVVEVASDGAVQSIPRHLVDGPNQLLTTEWPSPPIPSIVVTIGFLLAVSTAIAAELAGRRRWHLAPLVPSVLAYVTLLGLGAPVQTSAWLLTAIGLGAAGLALAPVDEPVHQRLRILAGDRTLAVTAVVAAVIGLGSSVVLGFSERADPRRVDSATGSAVLVDPIEATIALRTAQPSFAMFEIEDRSEIVNPVLPSRWRLLALEEYDGQRWVPEITLRPIGARLDPSTAEDDSSSTFEYTVEYRTDDIDLVPFPGRPLSIGVPVETDVDRVAVRLLDEPRVGLTIAAASRLTNVAATSDSILATRTVDEIAESLTETATALSGDGDVIQQLDEIERAMRDEWVLDSQAPGGGQQLKLLEQFLTETRRGTHEQFVTGFVLLARALGVDARVAIGFEVDPTTVSSPLEIRSTDATSWPEVRTADDVWLAFDPIPPSEGTREDAEQLPPDAQSPAAAQPPAEPLTDDDDEDEDAPIQPEATTSRWGRIVTAVGRFTSVVALALVPVLVAVAAIQTAKWQRRRRRLRDPDPYRRVRGAWANATDSLIDAGLTIEPSWTDDRIAVGAVDLAPTGADDLRRLAGLATAVTFDPTIDADRLVALATEVSDRIDAALRRERTRLQQLRWRLSLRSLRPATRSPVVV